MLNKICFIITTFLRDELLYKSVNSLIPWLGDNKIIIVDQGNLTEEKFKWLEDTGFEAIDHCCPNKNQRLLYYQVPFDSGLSYCRNYGVKKAKESDCQYVFIGSDSFLFNDSILKLNDLIEQKMFGYNIIGCELENSTCGWEGKLNLIEEESFELDFIDKKDLSLAKTDLNIFDVDICRNCFLAETNVLINTPWDENLKLCFEENTPIIVKNGYNKTKTIPIKNLFPPSCQSNIFSGYKKQKVKIWTKKGWQKLLCVSRKKTSEKMYTIKTTNSIIKLTENHPLIVNNKEIITKNLKIGDNIELCPYPVLSNKFSVSKDWAWMLGFFLAEGTCLSGKKIQARVEFTNQNKKFLKKCESVFANIGIECKWYINKTRKDKCSFLRIGTSRLLYDYFLCFYDQNEKIIPYFVYEFDKESRKAFLQGFFDGDGTKLPAKPVILNQKSPSIMNGLIFLTQDIYKHYYINNQTNKYGEWLKLYLKEQNSKTAVNKIVSIDINKTEKIVYDLECSGHVFSAGVGNVNVHNCEHEDEFYRLKLAKAKVGWTSSILLTKQTDRPTEYGKYRKEHFDNGIRYLMKKWNIKHWIKYAHIERAKETN